jgi:hypothetical protein
MTRLRSAWTAAALAARRLSARPLNGLVLAAAVAGAAALIGWGSLAGALAGENNVRVRLAEVPTDQRSVQTVYNLGPAERDDLSWHVRRFFSRFSEATRPVRSIRIWHAIGPFGIRIAATPDLRRDVLVTSGRLPRGCSGHVCEVLALAGRFRLGQRVPFEGVTARVVGTGTVRWDTLPVGSEALPRTPVLGDRALLVKSPEHAVRRLVRATGSNVVTSAALDPRAVRASDLRDLVERLREESVRVRRDTVRVQVTAPFELLDDINERNEVARTRLLLVSEQGAALILAFAVYVAAARRRELTVLDEQLDTLGASLFQIRLARVVEVALPCAAGAFLALVGLYGTAFFIARARGFPTSSFITTAVPWWAAVAIGAAACLALLLLVVVQRPATRRNGLGALELAALSAFALVVWQAATTGALDPQAIEEGEGVGPVLVLLPALTFFAAAVFVVRLLPPFLRRAEGVSRRASFTVRLGFLSAARRPGEAAAATTFLAIALGAALFGLNYRATLESQARDEASFTAGAQWRVTERPADSQPSASETGGHSRVGTDVQPSSGIDVQPVTGQADVTPLSRYQRATFERPTPVLRLRSGVSETDVMDKELTVEVLGLPASRIPDLAGWQDDFSASSREEIATALRPRGSGLGGMHVARNARELTAWMRSDTSLSRFVVLHFFLPDRQRFVHVRGDVLTRDWQRLTFALPAYLRGAELVGIEFPPVTVPLSSPPDRGSIEVSSFQQRVPDGWTPLEPIESWTASWSGGRADVAVLSTGPVRRALQFSLQGTALALLHPRLPPGPLPVFASPSVARAAVDGIVTLHGVGKDVPVRVVGTARLFPTIVEQPTSFVVVDYTNLFASLNADFPGIALPNEAWLFRPQDADLLERLSQSPFRVERVVGVAPLTARLVNDPLGAGARGVLLTASIVAAILAVFGIALATRSTVGAERVLFAEYEALGVPPTTIARSLQLRLVALSVLGVLAGLLGAMLAVRLVGAGVAVTGAGDVPVPPIEPVIAWGATIVLMASVAAGVLVSALLLARRALHEPAARRLRA